MRFFRTESAVSFHYGAVLGLTEGQAKSRLATGSIRALKKGVFEVVKEVEIKRGETIGIEGNVPKVLISKMTAVDEEKKGK